MRPFYITHASGHTDLVSLLARACQVPVLQADYQGELPLHWAVRSGRLEVVTLLIERFGMDYNAYVPRRLVRLSIWQNLLVINDWWIT